MNLKETRIGRNLKNRAGGVGLVISAGLMAAAGSACLKDNLINTPTPIIRTVPTVEPTIQLIPTPTLESKQKIAVPTPESPKAQWDKLPALERLKRLRANNSNLEGFDRQDEDTRAVVEFFCQNVMCSIPPDEIIENHFVYVDSTNISQKLKERGFDLTDSQISQEEESMSFVIQKPPPDNPNTTIFINSDVIGREAKRAVEEQPKLGEIPNFEAYLTQKTKFISLGYLNIPNEELALNEPFHYGDYYIYKFIGFRVGAKDEKGDEVKLPGIRIAMAELLAQKISTKSGFKLVNTTYKDGVELLSQLVSAAGISDQEFMEYTDGQRSISEFVERIGSLKKNESYDSQSVGANAIIEVGFVTSGTKDKIAGKKYLESILILQPTYER